MGTGRMCISHRRPLGSCPLPFCHSHQTDNQWLGTLPPSPQVRLPAVFCPNRLRLGVVGGVTGLGKSCHSAEPHPLLGVLL